MLPERPEPTPIHIMDWDKFSRVKQQYYHALFLASHDTQAPDIESELDEYFLWEDLLGRAWYTLETELAEIHYGYGGVPLESIGGYSFALEGLRKIWYQEAINGVRSVKRFDLLDSDDIYRMNSFVGEEFQNIVNTKMVTGFATIPNMRINDQISNKNAGLMNGSIASSDIQYANGLPNSTYDTRNMIGGLIRYTNLRSAQVLADFRATNPLEFALGIDNFRIGANLVYNRWRDLSTVDA